MGDDAELFRRWRALGDTEAGNALLTRHYASVYRFFRNKAPDAVDDLTQRTFAGVTQGAERFERRASFRSFLFGVARNVLHEHYRQRRREQVIDFGVSTVEDLEPTASQLLAARERERALLSALRRIPLDLQVALELHYWEALSTREMAEVLELPAGTVKRRLQRGRQALERLLAARGTGPDAAQRALVTRATGGSTDRATAGSTAAAVPASEDSA